MNQLDCEPMVDSVKYCVGSTKISCIGRSCPVGANSNSIRFTTITFTFGLNAFASTTMARVFSSTHSHSARSRSICRRACG